MPWATCGYASVCLRDVTVAERLQPLAQGAGTPDLAGIEGRSPDHPRTDGPRRLPQAFHPTRFITPDGTSASMRCGPGSFSALLNCFGQLLRGSSRWLAGTAHPACPWLTKFHIRIGPDRAAQVAFGAQAPAVPTRCSSSPQDRVRTGWIAPPWWTFNPSRAIVHSAEIVYNRAGAV